MATHEAKCADVDRVMARLERELHLLESDYQSTLQAEQANQGGACQNSNGSSQLGATLPSGDHGEDGNDKSDEDDVSAPEGYSILVGCDEASDSDEGDDAADGNHADTDVNKCAQEPTETSLGERGTSQQALCASSGATAIASTAAQPGISNDTDCDTGSLGGDATERRANHARMDAETAASIRTVMTDFVLPAPEWARGLDDETLLLHVGALLDKRQRAER